MPTSKGDSVGSLPSRVYNKENSLTTSRFKIACASGYVVFNSKGWFRISDDALQKVIAANVTDVGAALA